MRLMKRDRLELLCRRCQQQQYVRCIARCSLVIKVKDGFEMVSGHRFAECKSLEPEDRRYSKAA